MADADFVILCHSALVHQGSLSILGAGTVATTVQAFPAQVSLSIAGRIVWEPSDLGRIHPMRVVVRHFDGEPIADLQVPFFALPGPPEIPPAGLLNLPVPILVRRVGVYVVDFYLDGALLKTMEHLVVLPTPPNA